MPSYFSLPCLLLRISKPTHLSIQYGVRLFEEPFPARMIGDGDAGKAGVSFVHGSAAVGRLEPAEVRAGRAGPLHGFHERRRRERGVVRALGLENLSIFVSDDDEAVERQWDGWRRSVRKYATI